MRMATIAAPVGLPHVRYRRFGIFMFCFERGDQRVFGIHCENLRTGSEPEAYDVCRHELSPAERKTRIHISRKGHMLHHNLWQRPVTLIVFNCRVCKLHFRLSQPTQKAASVDGLFHFKRVQCEIQRHLALMTEANTKLERLLA